MSATTNYENILNEAVLRLIGVPLDERARIMLEIGIAYEDMIEKEAPLLARADVVELSRLFTVNVLCRVQDMTTVNSGAVGRA